MANERNLMQYRSSTPNERRENASKAGKASGEARRRKANLRQTMNSILTSDVDIPEWTPILEELGLDSTLETVISASMVREAINGNVKAYMAIKDVLGQTSKSDVDLEEQKLRIDATKANMGVDEEEQDDDGFLDALKCSVENDWDDNNEEDGWSDEGEEETADI